MYSNATAVECLVGYLWLTDQGRLTEVLDWAWGAMDAGGAREVTGDRT